MAVDLSDLIPALKNKLSPPGTDLYPKATDSQWLFQLINAFWEVRLQQLFTNYRCDEDGVVSPLSGAEDLPRDQQQLIILYAAYSSILSSLSNHQSSFRATAGPVSYEVQKSATVLKDLLAAVRGDLKDVVANLQAAGLGSGAARVLDGLANRTELIGFYDIGWTR